MCANINLHLCVRLCVCACVGNHLKYIYIHTNTYIYIYIYTSIYMYIYTCIMYIYMYVYAYMHIHMYTCIIYIHICMIHISCEEGRVMYDIKDAEAPQVGRTEERFVGHARCVVLSGPAARHQRLCPRHADLHAQHRRHHVLRALRCCLHSLHLLLTRLCAHRPVPPQSRQ